MRTIETQRLAADAAGIALAADLLRGGRLVAFGTETVYGLGADAADPAAIGGVFAAKGRPRHNPLIAHFADASRAWREVRPTRLAHVLAERFWPGPLTLVLPRGHDSTVCHEAAAGLATLAVRVPSGQVAQALLHAAGRPIAAPSANRSGRVSPSTSAHVLDGLGGRIDAVLECGPCPIGLESTVLSLDESAATVLRPGGVPVEAIEAALAAEGFPPLAARRQPGTPETGTPRPAAPGQLASHYAPSLPLRLDATSAEANEALLAFGRAPAGAGLVWNLSRHGDLDEAASRLFTGLRLLDAQAGPLGLGAIAVMPIPSHGLGLAIRDRLQRAAAPR